MQTKNQYRNNYVKKEKEKLISESEKRVIEKYGRKKAGKKGFKETEKFQRMLEEALANDEIYQSYINGSWLENKELSEQFENRYAEYQALAEKKKEYLEETKRKRQLVRSLDIERYTNMAAARLRETICKYADSVFAEKMFGVNGDGSLYSYLPDGYYDETMIMTSSDRSLKKILSVFGDERKHQAMIISLYRSLFGFTQAQKSLVPLIAQKIVSRYPSVRRKLDIDHEMKGHFADNTVCIPPFEKMIANEVNRVFEQETFIQQLCLDLSEEHVINILQTNPYYRPAFERIETQKRLNHEIQSLVNEETEQSIVDAYPHARALCRHFILHIGPTNSGKTHDATERMTQCNHGIYLAPLRLLAYEQYEKLEPFGCDLVTGEERIIHENSRFQSSTIEMLNTQHYYDICVIDEAQMLGDHDRGCHWAKAILGVRAPEIHVCLAPEAENIVKRLISMCHDTYEVIYHERKTKLQFNNNPFNFPDDVKPADALIVFSRKSVHAVAAELSERGIQASLIYGALPYDVRHREAVKFADGTNKVLVATDAIGMGMNLPIQRIVFLETEKFDGHNRRVLNPSEILQIAGRAGRYQKYDTGYVTSADNRKMIRNSLRQKAPEIHRVILPFPASLLEIKEAVPLSSIMESWQKLKTVKGFRKVNLNSRILLCKYVEKQGGDRIQAYDLSGIPVNTENYTLLLLWQKMAKRVIAQQDLKLEKRIRENMPKNDDTMAILEDKYKALDIIYGFALRYDEKYTDRCIVTKRDVSEAIIKLLSTRKYNTKKCSRCGRKLLYTYPYGMCEECYEEAYGYRNRWYDWL